MASALMHLAVAQEIAKRFEIDIRKFKYGNLLPDSTNNNPGAKALSHFRIQREPYELATTEVYQYYDYDLFYEKYKPHMYDDVYLGYFTHLLTDEMWVQRIYIKYMRDENRRKRIEEQKNYYHDYDVLNQIIKEKYSISLDLDMTEHQITEVDSSTASSWLEFVECCYNTTYNDKTLYLFKETDIINCMESIIEDISDLIIDRRIRAVKSNDHIEE